jgi:hypothetical protein
MPAAKSAGAPKKWARFEPVLAVVACATFFMPWHAVHDVVNDFSGLACAFMPDCHVSTPSSPPYESGVITTCTGYSHGTAGPIGAALLAVELLATVWVAFRPATLAVFVELIVTLGVVGHVFSNHLLAHLFDRVVLLAPQYVFWLVELSIIVAAVSRLARATYAAYLGRRLRRSSQARPIGESRAGS